MKFITCRVKIEPYITKSRKAIMNRSDSSFIISKVFKINFSAMLMGSFVAMSGILVDSVMISRFPGERSLTSYGVVMSVFLAVSALASPLSAGGQVLAGQFVPIYMKYITRDINNQK